MTLEDRLRKLAKAGELNYLSLAPRSDGKNFLGFAAAYCPASGVGTGFGMDKDPVAAIEQAIRDYKPNPKSDPKAKPKAQKQPTEKAPADPWE